MWQLNITTIACAISCVELSTVLQVFHWLNNPVECTAYAKVAILVDGVETTIEETVQRIGVNHVAIARIFGICSQTAISIVRLYQWRSGVSCLHDVPISVAFSKVMAAMIPVRQVFTNSDDVVSLALQQNVLGVDTSTITLIVRSIAGTHDTFIAAVVQTHGELGTL